MLGTAQGAEPHILMHTRPECITYPYEQPKLTPSGGTVVSKPKNVYCLYEDEPANASNNPIRNKLRELLLEKVIKSAFFSYYVLDDGINGYLVSAICSAAFHPQATITLMYSNTGEVAVYSRNTIRKIRECLTRNAPSAQIRELPVSRADGVQSMHNKLLMLQYSDGDNALSFSSGHFRFGTTINFDTWSFLRLAPSDELLRKHQCLHDSINKPRFTLDLVRSDYLSCASRLISTSASVEYFQMPFEKESVLRTLRSLFDRADKIDVEMSLVDPGGLGATLLLNAANRGARVRLLLDDDYLWASRGSCPNCYPKKRDLGHWFSLAMNHKNVELRFLQTANQHCLGNFLHSKNVIFSMPEGKTVLTGSMNFTWSALNSNMENVYFVQQTAAITFVDVFDERWSLAQNINEMPLEQNPKPIANGVCN